MSLTTPYRTLQAGQGLANAPLYNGDPGMDQNIKKLLLAAGQGPVYGEDGPHLDIPGKIILANDSITPNAATVSDNGTVAPVAISDPAAPATTDAGTASSGLSLKGTMQWAKDNPGKAVAVGIGIYLLLNEVFKTKR